MPALAVYTPTMVSPAHVSPSAAHFFTFTNPLGVVLLAYLPSSSVPGLAFVLHATAVLAPVCASPSAAAAGSAMHSFALVNLSGCYDPEPLPQFSAIFPPFILHSWSLAPLLVPSCAARTVTKSPDKSPDGLHD